MRTRLINLYGSPSSGKSVLMLRLAAHAKLAGQFCEVCPEVAKEYVVRDIKITGPVQRLITREQYRRLLHFIGHVDYLITDAPLLIGGFYAEDHSYPEAVEIVTWAAAEHRAMQRAADIVNVYVTRDHPFVQHGRYQDEAGAMRIEHDMLAYVRRHHDHATLLQVKSTADVNELWERLTTCPPESIVGV
jgi:hypothetical protein